MKTGMLTILLPAMASILLSGKALSQTTGASKILASGQFFYFSDENKQGGKDLPGGTTTFSTFGLQYNRSDYYSGLGLFLINDAVGKTQTNEASGLKFELFVPTLPYYFEYGIGFSASQKFTNRSAENRTGSMSYMGFGVRASLAPWLFFDGSFKSRTWTFTKEDGIDLPAKITKTELMPFLGLGIEFGI
jgi:hypothetical protein